MWAASARTSRAGIAVLGAGRRLRPQDVGVLASLGIAQCRGVPQPHVRIVVTGNEVVAPGRAERRVRDLRRQLGDAAGTGRARRRVLEAHFALVTTRRDPQCAHCAGRGCGAGLRRIERRHRGSRPAPAGGSGRARDSRRRDAAVEPRGCGRIGDALVFLLPGNPVSCLCAYDFFAGRAIRLRGGRPADGRTEPARAGRSQDRFGHRPRRLLPGAPARRRGRTAGIERRIGALVDHARRRLRRRARRQRRPRRRAAKSPCTSTTTEPPTADILHDAKAEPAAEAGQTQFLTVITRDEATARFRRHLKLAPLGHGTVPLAALEPRVGRRRDRRRRRARLRQVQRRRLRGASQRHVRRGEEEAPRGAR